MRRRVVEGVPVKALSTARGRIGAGLALSVVAVAVMGPLVAPHSPDAFVTGVYAPPSSRALLGGDNLGRDVLSRALDGGWVLLAMALGATLLGVGGGAAAGIVAAYRQGMWDRVVMRSADVLLAFPQLVFALLLVSVAGPRLWLIVVAVGLSNAPQVARVIRSATLELAEQDFVRAVELNRVPRIRVMTGEIAPNLITPLMVEASLRLTWSIVLISGLAFLGFGQPPPAPSWGIMVNENRLGLTANSWGVVAPAVLLAALTIGTNMYTDAVTRVVLGTDRMVEDPVVQEATARGSAS